ncbi:MULTISPECIES: NAD(P)/FAD-dependent oxidoreductase [Paracoccus]|jgi:glycine/D-amino acid oxidase-like deaminating enzyme|uniref:FAD-dependent oxidoreductase n=2 Tax=Paracoccus TaxID=265 RepID=A0A844H799_9RHOB|nr:MULTISPECIES: FAD-dependent oxidoreductase [Paracoccus]MTH35915.1 FAD-dependent oxidoreductase [Paracoccus limosus]RCW79047.1 glycine/D-amino acid oxidase-like deaminating enzyme [Paracoccus lutimaris]
MSADAGTAIIGGGIVGLCLALGLAARGHDVLVLDGRDADMRASQGNFGLVWLQGKGAGYAPYGRWSLAAVQEWAGFARRLQDLSGVDLALRQEGGYEFFTDRAEFDAFGQDLHRQAAALGDGFSFELLSHGDLAQRLPGIGQKVVGASFCPLDGHVNPLRLHVALRRACLASGVRLAADTPVTTLRALDRGYEIAGPDRAIRADRVVLCAGLGAATLGPQLGFRAPIRAQRGELLITERVADPLPFLSSTIRQVDEGGLQIGGTKAESDRDSESTDQMAVLARHAVAVWPQLADIRVLRSWAALRVMTPDGYPIYQRAPDRAGAFLVTCHSGVTLAPLHATRLAAWIDDDPAAPDLEAFDERRFALS